MRLQILQSAILLQLAKGSFLENSLVRITDYRKGPNQQEVTTSNRPSRVTTRIPFTSSSLESSRQDTNADGVSKKEDATFPADLGESTQPRKSLPSAGQLVIPGIGVVLGLAAGRQFLMLRDLKEDIRETQEALISVDRRAQNYFGTALFLAAIVGAHVSVGIISSINLPSSTTASAPTDALVVLAESPPSLPSPQVSRYNSFAKQALKDKSASSTVDTSAMKSIPFELDTGTERIATVAVAVGVAALLSGSPKQQGDTAEEWQEFNDRSRSQPDAEAPDNVVDVPIQQAAKDAMASVIGSASAGLSSTLELAAAKFEELTSTFKKQEDNSGGRNFFSSTVDSVSVGYDSAKETVSSQLKEGKRKVEEEVQKSERAAAAIVGTKGNEPNWFAKGQQEDKSPTKTEEVSKARGDYKVPMDFRDKSSDERAMREALEKRAADINRQENAEPDVPAEKAAVFKPKPPESKPQTKVAVRDQNDVGGQPFSNDANPSRAADAVEEEPKNVVIEVIENTLLVLAATEEFLAPVFREAKKVAKKAFEEGVKEVTKFIEKQEAAKREEGRRK